MADKLPAHRRTVENYAAIIHAPYHSTVSHWLNENAPPRGHYLKRIAEATGVAVDWLLGLVGEDDSPIYRYQSRDTAELAADVGAYVARELRTLVDTDRALARMPTRVRTRVRAELAIDGAKVLRAVVNDQRRALHKAWWYAQASTGASEMALDRIFDSGLMEERVALPEQATRQFRKFLTTTLRGDEHVLDAFWTSLTRQDARKKAQIAKRKRRAGQRSG